MEKEGSKIDKNYHKLKAVRTALEKGNLQTIKLLVSRKYCLHTALLDENILLNIIQNKKIDILKYLLSRKTTISNKVFISICDNCNLDTLKYMFEVAEYNKNYCVSDSAIRAVLMASLSKNKILCDYLLNQCPNILYNASNDEIDNILFYLSAIDNALVFQYYFKRVQRCCLEEKKYALYLKI